MYDEDLIDDEDLDVKPKKRAKNDFLDDGICETCGNSGLSGDRCPCGGTFVNLNEGLEDFEAPDEEDPETYSLDDLGEEEAKASSEEEEY